MKKIISAIAAVIVATGAAAAETVDLHYEATLTANSSTGNFAPYLIGSWNYGKYNAASGIWQGGLVTRSLNLGRRFSWGAGVEYLLGYGSENSIRRFNSSDNSWTSAGNRPSSARIQQLYGELKYRAAYLIVGMKERHSRIVDDRLSSGDLTRSNNSRPVPGIAAGFLDFQDIPFTNGWVQIDGEIMYGKFTDSQFREKTFNYYDGPLATGLWYTYKRCYFRTKPTQPFVFTIGMQAAGQFAGKTRYYRKGIMYRQEDRGFHFRDIFDMFFPREGSGEDYYKGNSLGSWDVKATYSFGNGSVLSAYFEGPFEDGSGIGRQNGWDGLWGLQYNFAQPGIISKVLLEYFDFTNQSGPIHWAPGDFPGTDITSGASGGDSYYNNVFYGAYSNYGMSIGSPFTVSPLYNENGSVFFNHSRARGFHAALEGNPSDNISYVAKISYQKAGGAGRIPAVKRLSDTSAMIGVLWRPSDNIPGLQLKAEAAFDAGKLRGNNFGGLVGISYSGNISLAK